MRIAEVGIQVFRDRHFIVKRPSAYHYILQLFWTPMYLKLDGKVTVTPAHTLVIIDKDKPHHYHALEDNMVNDYIRFTATEDELEGLILNKPLPLSQPERFHNIIRCLHAEFNTVNVHRISTSNHLMQALLSKCRDLYAFYSDASDTSITKDSFIQLRNDILAFPYREWKVSEMADRCNLSVSRFQCAYKQAFSASPMADVLNARILLAKNLLAVDRSVKEIAKACGYKSDIHFMNQFKKMTGMTPTTYRKKNKS